MAEGGRLGDRDRIRRRLYGRAWDAARVYGVPWPQAWRWIERSIPNIVRHLMSTLPGHIGDYEIDHVLPLKQCGANLQHPDGWRAAWAARNLQWLRAGTNRSKGARVSAQETRA